MQLLAILALVAVLSAVYEKRKSEKKNYVKPDVNIKEKQMDDIRRNKATGHYSVKAKERTVYKNGKPVKMISSVFLSSKGKDGKKDNIPLKKNPDPEKVKLKKQLDKYYEKGLITQAEYNRLCNSKKVNSYFMKRVRELEESTYSSENLVETKGWSLDPDDKDTAFNIFQTHTKNKENLRKGLEAKAAKQKQKK